MGGGGQQLLTWRLLLELGACSKEGKTDRQPGDFYCRAFEPRRKLAGLKTTGGAGAVGCFVPAKRCSGFTPLMPLASTRCSTSGNLLAEGTAES